MTEENQGNETQPDQEGIRNGSIISRFGELGNECINIAKEANHPTVQGYVQSALHYLETSTLYIKSALEFAEIIDRVRKEHEKNGQAEEHKQPDLKVVEPEAAS